MADFDTIFNRQTWAAVPFHFWSVVFFAFGCMVGSLLNVCIHRMPLGQSIVHPRSHCPHCQYSIPWFLNMPLITWLYLRGKCANCQAPISIRYFLVELLTGFTFLGCWLAFGGVSVGVALVGCLIMAGFIVAIFIDLEHLIIPDEITIGGIVVGFLCSAAVPMLHNTLERPAAMRASALGIVVGGGLVYLILRGGKMAFGREKMEFEGETKVVFTETGLQLPDKEIPFDEIFYRKSDFIQMWARTVELPDRCYWNTVIKLTPEELKIGEEKFNPEEIPHMEVVTQELILPREAMGFGDVKFMAAIGAFMGWPATIFSLLASSILGSVVALAGVALRKREFSSRIPYGPYIAVAAAVWFFLPRTFHTEWTNYLMVFKMIFSDAPLQ